MNKPLLFLSFLFISIIAFSQESGLYLKVNKKGYYVFENAKGKTKINKKLTSASCFSEGVAVATTVLKYGVIDTLGNWVVPQEFYDIGDFHDGVAWFKHKENDLFGFMNKKGDIFIRPEYQFVSDFQDGYCIIGNPNIDTTKFGDGKYVYQVINMRNKKLSNAEFTGIIPQSDSSFQCFVRRDEYKLYFDGRLELIYEYSEKETEDTLLDDMILFEKNPEYIGGDEARLKFLINTIHYPLLAKEYGFSGITYCSFVVEKDGLVSNAKIIKGVHPSIDKEVLRVVRAMPKWIPGEQVGEKVRCLFNMPLKFTLGPQ